MASTLTLPPFFTEWVANGVREWMDANKVPCIPFVCAEVEVERVCAYYYVPTEISRYIQRLAFSKHLPYTIPPTIYELWSPPIHILTFKIPQLRVLFREGEEYDDDFGDVVNGRPLTAFQHLCDIDCGEGRMKSIRRSLEGNSDPRNIPNGKFRNEAIRHYGALYGTHQNKARIFNGPAHLDENGRGYENMYRKFKGVKNARVWYR